MLHAIDLRQAVIGTMRNRLDKSMSFTVNTPELTAEQMVYLMGYTGTNARVFIAPLKDEAEILEVVTPKKKQSPSQQLRFLMMATWRKENPLAEEAEFTRFYEHEYSLLLKEWRNRRDKTL